MQNIQSTTHTHSSPALPLKLLFHRCYTESKQGTTHTSTYPLSPPYQSTISPIIQTHSTTPQSSRPPRHATSPQPPTPNLYNHLPHNICKKCYLYATMVRFLIFATAGRRASPHASILAPTLMQVRRTFLLRVISNFRVSGVPTAVRTLDSGKKFREREITLLSPR